MRERDGEMKMSEGGEIKGNYHENQAGKAWIVCI